MTDWKSQLGFSDRLNNIRAITKACQVANASQDAQAMHQQGVEMEESIYKNATSKLDYTTKCRKATDALEDVVTAEYPPIPEIDRSGLRTEHGELAQQIGPYEHAVYHRDGRTATVYRSRNKSGQLVALKATSPHLMFAPHNSEREARILREAAHHNVAELLETFYEIGGHFILVFPFLSFQLDQLLRHDALSMKQTRRCLADLFRALSHIHSLGIIHRDVKPSNVLLRSASGPAVLADFGIAWSPRDKDSESPDEKITDVGTEAYRPPELLFGYQSYGPELDIWAAGCVAAEAVRPGHDHLFDSGPLGSDLALVQSIFSTLGTPNTDTWPSVKKLPDWGKVQFKDYPSKPWDTILSDVDPEAIDLVAQLVRYGGEQRVPAQDVIHHPFLSGL